MTRTVDELVGTKLRFYREARGLSSSDLASAVGVSEERLGLIEAGAIRATIEELDLFARSLRLKISEFFVDVIELDDLQIEIAEIVRLQR